MKSRTASKIFGLSGLLLFSSLLVVAIGLLSRRGQPLVVTYLYHTNTVNGHGTAILRVQNRTPRDYAFTVDTESLVDRKWGQIVYRNGDLNSSCSGFVGGGSNILVQVRAPEENERFFLRYSMVPSQLENHASWALTRAGIKYPFGAKDQTIVIYPGK